MSEREKETDRDREIEEQIETDRQIFKGTKGKWKTYKQSEREKREREGEIEKKKSEREKREWEVTGMIKGLLISLISIHREWTDVFSFIRKDIF